MALETNELFASRDFSGRPRMVVERNKVGTIGPQNAAVDLPVGTPVAWNTSTSQWDTLTQGGGNGTAVIAGFIAHLVVSTDATDDVQAIIMLAGEVHRDDINTAAIRTVLQTGSGAAISEAQLDVLLKAATLRDKGITVRGLAAVAG